MQKWVGLLLKDKQTVKLFEKCKAKFQSGFMEQTHWKVKWFKHSGEKWNRANASRRRMVEIWSSHAFHTKLTTVQHSMVWTKPFADISSFPSKASESTSTYSLDQLSFLLTKVVAPTTSSMYHDESTLWKHCEALTGPNEFVRYTQHKYVHRLICCLKENEFWFN